MVPVVFHVRVKHLGQMSRPRWLWEVIDSIYQRLFHRLSLSYRRLFCNCQTRGNSSQHRSSGWPLSCVSEGSNRRFRAAGNLQDASAALDAPAALARRWSEAGKQKSVTDESDCRFRLLGLGGGRPGQANTSRSHTAADALGAPMGCGDNRDQPRPARSGRSVCWAGGCWMRLALVSVVWGSHEEERHRSAEHFVAQHLASNACRRGLSSQARWAEESGVWSRLPRQGRVETGGWVLGNECLLLFPNLPLVHIAKSRFSHALPCRHTVEMGAGAWFEPLQAGSHCFGEGFSEGRFDVSSEISGRPAVKIPIWLWLLAKSGRRRVGVLSGGPDSCRSSVGPGLGGRSPRLAKTTRQGRAWETTALEIGQSQRTSLLAVRGPRVRAMEPRYISFITVFHSAAQAKRRAPAPAVDSDRWLALLAHGLEDLDVFIGWTLRLKTNQRTG